MQVVIHERAPDATRRIRIAMVLWALIAGICLLWLGIAAPGVNPLDKLAWVAAYGGPLALLGLIYPLLVWQTTRATTLDVHEDYVGGRKIAHDRAVILAGGGTADLVLTVEGMPPIRSWPRDADPAEARRIARQVADGVKRDLIDAAITDDERAQLASGEPVHPTGVALLAHRELEQRVAMSRKDYATYLDLPPAEPPGEVDLHGTRYRVGDTSLRLDPDLAASEMEIPLVDILEVGLVQAYDVSWQRTQRREAGAYQKHVYLCTLEVVTPEGLKTLLRHERPSTCTEAESREMVAQLLFLEQAVREAARSARPREADAVDRVPDAMQDLLARRAPSTLPAPS